MLYALCVSLLYTYVIVCVVFVYIVCFFIVFRNPRSYMARITMSNWVGPPMMNFDYVYMFVLIYPHPLNYCTAFS